MSKNNRELILCNIYLFLMAIITFLENFEDIPSYIIKMMKIFCIAIAIIPIWKKKINQKQLISLIMIVALLSITYKKSGSQFFYLITNIITIYLIKDISIKSVIKPIFFGKLLMFIILIFCLLVGSIENQIFYRLDDDNNYITRYTLGFKHPNTAYWNYFSLISLYIYYKYDKLNIKHIVTLFIMSYIMYILTDSRTGLLCAVLYLIFVIISKKMKNICENAIVKKIITYSFPIFLLASIIPSFMYSKYDLPVINLLNNLMSNRIYLGSLLYERYSIGLLGQTVALYDNNIRLTIDNGYIYMSVAFGAIFTIVFAILYIKLSKELYNRKMYFEILSILIFNIYSLSEKLFFNIFTNFTILFFVFLLFKKQKNDTEQSVEEHIE